MKNIYLLILLSNHLLFGQAFSFSSIQNGKSIKHRVLMDDEYIVETQFMSSSSQFVKTIGGFYQKNGNDIIVNLEFNSNFSNDSLKTISISDRSGWKKISKSFTSRKWLMSGRVRKTERRRDTKIKKNNENTC